VQVRITQALNGQLIAERLDPNVLVTRFSEWKAGDEYSSYFFGKDALGLNTSILRHVHMIPLHDAEQLASWNRAWGRRPPARKTSDRYLFYCDGGAQHGYLLIYIVGDPGAHDFLNSPETRQLLAAFEQCADQFIHFGTFTV